MNSSSTVTNVVLAGLGGQGVLKASDILADAALRAGWDVKKSELHGMSQRGGSVSSDVRFGAEVLSPIVPVGEADFLLALASDQVEPNRQCLRPGATLITPEEIDASRLQNRKSLNVALLGRLSQYLNIADEHWLAAIRAHLPDKLHAANEQAFETGRTKPGPPVR